MDWLGALSTAKNGLELSNHEGDVIKGIAMSDGEHSKVEHESHQQIRRLLVEHQQDSVFLHLTYRYFQL